MSKMGTSMKRFGYVALTTEERDTFLREARQCVVCSHNADGTIHATPTWFLYDDKKILVPIHRESRKAKNIQRCPSITIMVEELMEGKGLRYVLMYGTAYLDTEDVMAKILNLNETKYNAGDMAKQYFTDSDYIVTFKPEHFVTSKW
jgi:nitroimidazol reductase NimA-like FMN-containing flavoprotein (pyridoxamine 5'-phosphate oxidase superfamily)